MGQVSTSFVQDQRHITKSDRFVVLQPSQIATVLADHGFDLVGLKTGRAKQVDKQDFQTTTARYRSRNVFEVEGLSLDIMFRVPHLYGALEARLGFFRGLCANQWNMGKLFNVSKVRHSGDALEQINQLIPGLVAQRGQLIETIQEMRMRDVTPGELLTLADSVAKARLDGVDNVTRIETRDLMRPRRQGDVASDLFTVTNVLQENATRFGLRYSTTTTDLQGQTVVRNFTTRRINEASVKAIDLNASIWDIATGLVKAA